MMSKSNSLEILMDGTFKILPRHMKFSQLYIISFIFKGRSYPFAFALMEKRDTDSYDCLFTNLKSLLNDFALKVDKIMTDYEKAVRKSAKKQFPNARISGLESLVFNTLFFHFLLVS